MMQKVSYGYVVTNNTALPAYGELTKKVLYKDKLHSAFNQYFFFLFTVAWAYTALNNSAITGYNYKFMYRRKKKECEKDLQITDKKVIWATCQLCIIHLSSQSLKCHCGLKKPWNVPNSIASQFDLAHITIQQKL